METKKHIRNIALTFRNGLSDLERAEKSRIIMEKVMDMEGYRQAEAVLVYAEYQSEVETQQLIGDALDSGKAVYCPKVNGEDMDFYRILSKRELSEGYRGIREPQAAEDRLFTAWNAAGKKCLMIMPGSAFDESRNRIGYGKGYYDKYLAKIPDIPTIAVCFACQIFAEIPSDTHDRKPDIIITEEKIYT